MGPPDLATASGRPSATDSYRLAVAFLLIMAASAVDVFDHLDRGGLARYGILLIPVAAVVLNRLRFPSTLVRAPSSSDTVLSVLFAAGLIGSLFGARYLGTVVTARSVFLPMALGLLYLTTIEEPTGYEVDRLVGWLSLIGGVYAAMNALVNLEVFPALLEFKQYRNASVAYVVMGLVASATLGLRARTLAIAVCAIVIFITYPSATAILIVGAVGLTWYVTSPRASGLRPLVVTGAFLGVTILAMMNFNTGVRITGEYFAAVDKADANSGRLDLWADGIARFTASPVVGSAFTGEIVAVRARDGAVLPYHNDFILFLAGGGLLGIALFVGWIALTEVTLVRRYRGFVQHADRERARLLRVILVTLNAFFVALCFNPVLPGTSRSATIFGLYAIAMSVGMPWSGVPPREVSGPEATSGRTPIASGAVPTTSTRS